MESGSNAEASWRIHATPGGDAIWVTFSGPTRTQEIAEFIQALNARMPSSSAKVVFDLRKLDGYNPDTNEPMKAWVRENKLAIRELTVLLPRSSTFLRMLVAAIGLATGVKINVREDTRDIQPQLV